MSQENIEVVGTLFEQFARGDFSAYSDLPDDFELVLASEMPDAGSYRGEAARRWLRSWVESFDRLTVEAIESVDAGEQVWTEMLQRAWLAGSDGAVELRTWSVSTFRNGAIVRWELFLTRAEALEAAGLSE
jgi:ketosteroid isomerase-like protein